MGQCIDLRGDINLTVDAIHSNEYFSVRNYLKVLWELVELNNQEDLLPVKGLSFQEIYFHPNDFSDELKLKILLLFFKNAKVRIGRADGL